MFTDASGEGDHIHTPEARRHRTDTGQKSVPEHRQSQQGPLMASSGSS